MGLSPGFTVLIILPAFLLHTSGLYVASSVNSLQHVLGEYGLVRPISVDAEGRFLSHAVSAGWVAGGQSRRRRRREVGEGNNEWENREHLAHQERLYYNVTVFGREFHLRLRHNARLVAPGAKMEWHDDSDNIRYSEPLHDECLYVGDITDTPGATAAISNCDGLRQQVQERSTDILLPSDSFQIILGDPKAFPGQRGCIIPLVSPGSSLGVLPISTTSKGRHPNQMPEPHQQTPFDVEGQRLYSELPPYDGASHPISEAEPGHPTKEAHFSCLYPGSRYFDHDPRFMTLGEGWNEDRPVNQEFCKSTQLLLTTTDRRNGLISENEAPIRRPISRSILSSHVNKTPRYLNSST